MAVGFTCHLCEDISDASLQTAVANAELKKQKKT